jgi:hypothetical protein
VALRALAVGAAWARLRQRVPCVGARCEPRVCGTPASGRYAKAVGLPRRGSPVTGRPRRARPAPPARS